eukprot:CAMPEP_0202490104 /NCGR_PEP_ID=MMETSP1361-20130828/7612_1 /ASSEMBLY_ACC=CAM_ASM_000849 /TAXON_ID=210615 /ORGANISM="Staurosira complex sp., Strain CCMP2646" /LENGTH=89 /DNA_ID=CAMNT_0049119933 /DNA_START=120 /DNA_END=386 /DNA_ORIENTATION=+
MSLAFNGPHTRESTDTLLQSPKTNTSPSCTVYDAGCMNRSINRSGSAAHKFRFSLGAAPLMVMAPLDSTATTSPGPAASNSFDKQVSIG